jgi:hypothetical protein
MSRLSLQTPMVAILNPKDPKFTGKDANYLALIALTIAGALDGYSVFFSSIPYDEVPASVIQVLKNEDKSAALLSSSRKSPVTSSTSKTSDSFRLIMGRKGSMESYAP